MKHILHYSLLFSFLCLTGVKQAAAQNTGDFMDQRYARYKWTVNGQVAPPQTDVLTIYPNPTRDYVEIYLEEVAWQPVHVWILDLNGTVLKTQTYQPQGNRLAIDVSNLPAGEYALHIKEEGKAVRQLRLLRDQ